MDDFSRFMELCPAVEADHVVVVKALMQWFMSLGIVPIHVSDRNRVIRDLCHCLDIKQHFYLPNLHWPHGTIERQNHEVLFALRSLTLEMQLSFEDWPDILPMANCALNHSVNRLLGYAPVTLFT
jgi:hypothetical protein